MIETRAPLTSSLFMMARELPSYLSTAYDLRFADEPIDLELNVITKIYIVFARYITLIKESFYSHTFEYNTRRLDADFQRINTKLRENTKPICAYMVSSYDSNGAILGDRLYYYHHYKIQQFEKHYAVAAKVVRSQSEMKEFLREIKASNPNREIKIVDIVAHGEKSQLYVPHSSSSPSEGFITPSNLLNGGFEDCAPDASIILDACSAGRGHHNIADEIAKKNIGKTVYAPGVPLCFSKLIINTDSGSPKLDHIVHGFALVNAYTFKQFHYTEAQPAQIPYTKDNDLPIDLGKLLPNRHLCTSRFDAFINRNSAGLKQRTLDVFQSLSSETQELVKQQVWKNEGSPLDRGVDFGGEFIRANPQRESVLSAFRTVVEDMKNDGVDCPDTRLAVIDAIGFIVLQIKSLITKLTSWGHGSSDEHPLPTQRVQ